MIFAPCKLLIVKHFSGKDLREGHAAARVFSASSASLSTCLTCASNSVPGKSTRVICVSD